MKKSLDDLVDKRLALAFDAANLGSWTWDMTSGTTTWDARLEEMHGLPRGGFGGTFEDWLAALHPDDRDECVARVEEALADPGPYLLLHRTTWPDGSVHTIECRGTVLVGDDGEPIGTTGVAIDVTMREQLVSTLQQTLLPAVPPSPRNITVATRYRAAERSTTVGGDWYAVVPLDDDRVAVAIGDVAGHGLDAVAEMAAARFSLRAYALSNPRPETVLQSLNDVVKRFHDGSMITALYGVLDRTTHTWTYASAGHLPALVRHADGTTTMIVEPRNPPLGIGTKFTGATAPVDEGSTLVLYTDGLIERRSESLDVGFDRLRAACARAASAPGALCDQVMDALIGETANEDDIAMVALRYTDRPA